MKKVLISKSVIDTEKFAKSLGNNTRGREVFELIGDIGSGKTTFTKGLVAGTGSTDHVTSSTFTIKQKYEGEKTIYHYDFYRLEDPGLMRYEVEESLNSKKTITIVEWGNSIKEVLPEDHITITLETLGEHRRKITIRLSPKFKYLLP